jgi:FtsP/CotA-like multicopper oxidase with cupredoxin domain
MRPSQRLLVIATMLAAGLTASAPALAAPVQVDLCAKAGTLALPRGVTVNVWGFAQLSGTQTCADVSAEVPGPMLDVTEGDVVTVTVHNGLAEDVSFEVPGEAIQQGPATAPPGGTADFTFTAAAPGTFGYQSPAHTGRQIPMGLYGALIVRPAGHPDRAYADASTRFDVERVLVLSAIDQGLNLEPSLLPDPGGFDMYDWAPKHWLINGKAYPQTDPIDVAGGQRLLLRYVNAGFENTSMALLGAHERVVAQDAFALSNQFDAVAQTIAAGQTADAIVTVPSGARFPLYNRQLHLTNGEGALGDAGFWPGGMLTFINGT